MDRLQKINNLIIVNNHNISVINGYDLSYESVFFKILSSILDFSTVPDREKTYTINPDNNLTWYERTSIHKSLTKPALSDMAAKLDEIKLIELKIKNDSLSDLNRQKDIIVRWEAIGDIRMMVSRLGFKKPNLEIYLNDILKNNLQSELTAMEAEGLSYSDEAVKMQTKKDRKALGKEARRVCDDILDIIGGWNLTRSLTDAQIDEMQLDFIVVDSYLRSFRPYKAKAAIALIKIDNVLVTQEMYDEVMEVFSSSFLSGL